MTMKFYSVPNDTGLAKLSTAIALNQKLNITTMAVGDGGGLEVVPNKNKNALVNEKYRANVSMLEPDPTIPGRFTATLVIPPEIGGFEITEGILFCDDGTAFSNASLTPGRKSTPAEGGIGEYIVELVFQLMAAEASAVQLIVNPYLTIATRQHVASTCYTKQEVDALIAASRAADTSNSTIAPAEGLIVFFALGDKTLQATTEGKLLTVFVDRDVDLKLGKCRLLAPGTEKLNTKNGLHEIANLVGRGPHRFLRNNGVWKQL
ncbi:MAG: phage tail protein [Gammaproteobacteria bacterium]|nr:phage tail protein [Gammaproteobacteria bacterium]